MPQKNQSSRIGSSPSPIVNRVLQSGKNVQQPCGSNPTSEAFNKKPIK